MPLLQTAMERRDVRKEKAGSAEDDAPSSVVSAEVRKDYVWIGIGNGGIVCRSIF